MIQRIKTMIQKSILDFGEFPNSGSMVGKGKEENLLTLFLSLFIYKSQNHFFNLNNLIINLGTDAIT